MLSRPPSKVSMLDVVEAIDGPISLNDCTLAPETCDHSEECPMHDIWSSLQKELVAKLSTSTFDKFVR